MSALGTRRCGGGLPLGSLMLCSLLCSLDASAREMPDAGSISATKLGRELAGRGVAPLASQWISGLEDDPVLARMELEGSSGAALSFYQVNPGPADGGTFDVVRQLRIDLGDARTLEQMATIDLGAGQGNALLLVVREDLPEEQLIRCVIVGAGLHVIYDEKVMDTHPAGASRTLADHPIGFSWLTSARGFDRPVLQVDQGSMWVPLEGPSGPVAVEIGRHRAWYVRRDQAFSEVAREYLDFLGASRVSAPGHPRLTDGKPGSSETLKAGGRVTLDVHGDGPLVALRVMTGCPKGELDGGAIVPKLRLTAGDRTFEVEKTKGTGLGLLGVGEFTAGANWVSQELIFFDPPLTAKQLTLELEGSGPDGHAVCLDEITGHTGRVH